MWEPRWRTLGIEKYAFGGILDDIEARLQKTKDAPAAETAEDDFGDFASASRGAAFTQSLSFAHPPNPTSKSKYQRAHALLKPLVAPLSSDAPPHTILSTLTASSTRLQSKTLHFLALFLSPAVQPLRTWQTQLAVLRSAIDRFDASLLAAFDRADETGDETAMRDAAEASWELCDADSGDWEMGKVWADKREIFYEQGRWKPLDNFTCVPAPFSTRYICAADGIR